MHPRRLALFTFIDAFGWEILQRHSFLDDVLAIRSPLETILGYSSTCVPTILTGKLPRDHGHFAFFCYSPERSPFGVCRCLRFLPQSIAGRGRARRLISSALRRYCGYTGYFQLYDMPFEYLHLFEHTEPRDLFAPGGINTGAPTIFDHLRGQQIPFFLSDWRASEVANLKALKRALCRGHAAFAYLYLAGMDAVLHAKGTQHRSVSDKVEWYDTELRQVLAAAAEHYDSVRLYVFSDHGMTDTTEDCDLMSRIASLGLDFGVDYAAAYDGTMARFWFLNGRARDRIAGALQEEALGRILSEEEMRDYGCDFPTNRYGDAVFLLNPGILLCPSFMSRTHLVGMHGYDPAHKDSTAMFACGAEPVSMPRRLDDMYGLMRSEAERAWDGRP